MTTTILGSRLGALSLAALFLAGSASAIEKPGPDDPPHGAVLISQEPRDFMGFCSKPGEAALWEPDSAEIARLEKRLSEFMAGVKTPPDYQPLHEYYRQYVGFVRNAKKTICVNAFHYTHVQDDLKHIHLNPTIQKLVQEGMPAEDYWKRLPVGVSDGGAYYFQVEYDVETGTFSELAFNGHA